MSDETLSDPLLGTLRRRSATRWVGRAWFTPKHEVEVVFDHRDEAGRVLRLLARARAAYARMRRGEWRYRLLTAEWLSEYVNPDWHGGRGPDVPWLARRLVLLRVRLYGDGSGGLVYQGPPPFDGLADCGVDADGSRVTGHYAPRAGR